MFVKDANGCSVVENFAVNSELSFQDEILLEARVYRYPTEGILHVLLSPHDSFEYVVYFFSVKEKYSLVNLLI